MPIISKLKLNKYLEINLHTIKSMLVLFFNFEVQFIKRQTNMVVHTTVRAACSDPNRHVF